MAPAFSKEAILQGNIDHLCLVCESYLRSEREVCLHVATAEHTHNLDKTDYVEKYKHDRIRKVKKWYYCEFCNILVSTLTKVRLHVEQLQHKQNIVSQKITRVDDVIVAGDVAISEEAWHGFIDENTCAICNVEFEDQDNHKSEPTHIIKLIQSDVNTDLNNTYRKIDDSTFHCLTCNTVVVGIRAHLDDTKHKNLIQKCNKIKREEDCKKENIVEKVSPQVINKADAIDDKKKTNENTISSEKITSNKTHLENKSYEKIDKHTTDTVRNKYIICNLDGKTECSLCDCVVHPLKIKTHVESAHHSNMLELRKDLGEKSNTKGSKDNKLVSNIVDSIPKFQKENININFESRTAVCRKCSVNLEFDSKVIDTHIEEHKNVPKKAPETMPILFEKGKQKVVESKPVLLNPENKNKEKIDTKPADNKTQKHDDIIQKLIEAHDFTCTDNKIYCPKCNKQIPLSERNINEHINGEIHRNNVKILSNPTHSKDNESKKTNIKKCNLIKVSIPKFIRTITIIKNVLAEDVVINEKYCINIMAFTFITMIGPGKFMCQACEVNLQFKDIKEHIHIQRHDRAINEVPVIIHSDSEFIREIRSEIFHCGFCNSIDSWNGMENHLKSTSHKESKTYANWRLSEHLPLIEKENRERQIHNEFLMRLIFP